MTNLLRITLIGFLMLMSACICVRRVNAQVDPWEFEVYPYATETRGTVELETDNAVVAKGHSQGGEGTASGRFPSQSTWYNQFELTYGLTDRIEAAAYLNMAMPNAAGYRYAGSKYRLRGRLFEEDVLPVNLGWYLELEWHKTPQFDDDELELEMRPIIEKDFGGFSLVANPQFEKPIFVGPNHNKGFKFGYAAGIYYRWRRYLSPGVEFYGAPGYIDDNDPLHQQQHYVFPVVWGALPHGIEYSVGPGIGMTRGSDRVLIKFNLELERFVGAIFGPSSESGAFL
ncbi:MAG TPA: hypothetical protein VIX59_02045 [Candidatus Binataceae bacterium]